jgi:hypothetical protein
MNAIADLARSDETFEGVLGAGILLLPVQLVDRETNRAEKRLMLAVLTEAVATFLRHLEAKTGRGQRLFREAEEWIESEDMSWTFAFENVCQTVGLDAEYLRGGLERLKERRPAGRAPVDRFRRISGHRTSVVPTRSRERAEDAEQKRPS